MIDEEAVQAMKSHLTHKSDRFAVKTFAKMTSFILHFFKKRQSDGEIETMTLFQ